MRRRDLLAMPLGAAPKSPSPNVVFVLVDDLRFDELACTGHPFAQTPNADRLAREGANFPNAFATTPLCSPSRASFLTGQYAHTHGVFDNVARNELSHRLVTWPRLLHDAGYQTGFFGKWHMGNDDSPRPGFDTWVSFPGQGESMDPVLNENGRTGRVKGYITDLLTDRAVSFMERARKPFCVYLAHKAIHPNIVQRDDGSISGFGLAEDFIVAERHKSLYAGMKLPRRGNYARPPHDKPALARKIGDLPELGPATATDDATILNRMRMAKAIDESLGRMIETLERARQLDNTMFVYTSDHGYFYGEHGLNYERRLAYEETIRIPLIVRYPPAFRPGSRPPRMVMSIDVAPTVLDLAGVRSPHPMHGRSLTSARRRDAVLVELFSDTVFPRMKNMGYESVRGERWKYIRYRELQGMDELYDLKADPFELHNLIGSESGQLRRMRERLDRLLRESGGQARS